MKTFRFCLLVFMGTVGCAPPVSSPETVKSSTTEPRDTLEDNTGRVKLADVATSSPETNPTDPRPGEDWPEFLGPRQNGISGETGLIATWPEAGPPLLWERKIGTGYSAPSIRNGRLVIHYRQRNSDRIEALNSATGELLWSYDYETDFADPYGYNNGPRASPLLTAKRCYTYGAQGKLLCLDLATGKKIWERDTMTDWPVPDHFFGAGCSPVLEGNLLIVAIGGQPDAGVVAFHPETGAAIWEAVGKSNWDGAVTSEARKAPYKWTGKEMVVSYSPPIAATIHGQRHLLCLMRQGLVSLDPATGKVRFKYWFRAKVHESVNAARPVVIDDLVFLSAAYDVGAALLKVAADGESVTEVWRDAEGLSTHWSTTIHHDGFLYGFSGRHEQEARLQCRDLKTGALKWETAGFEGSLDQFTLDQTTREIRNRETGNVVPFPFYGRGSKILADERFIVLGERGTLALVEVNPDRFRELCRTSFKQIQSPSWSAPVLSHGRLYLRSESHLLCLDLLPPEK